MTSWKADVRIRAPPYGDGPVHAHGGGRGLGKSEPWGPGEEAFVGESPLRKTFERLLGRVLEAILERALKPVLEPVLKRLGCLCC